MSNCCICDQQTAPRQCLCGECQEKYGSEWKAWPSWVKALRRIQRRFDAQPCGITSTNGRHVGVVSLSSRV